MAILRPNIPATLRRLTGFSPQGRSVWSEETKLKVAIVTLKSKIERSSVRADSSASRGRAEEARADGVVLVPPDIAVVAGNRLGLLGAQYEVVTAFPRHGLDGSLGHTQVELAILAGS
jgi:hypothetical protein